MYVNKFCYSYLKINSVRTITPIAITPTQDDFIDICTTYKTCSLPVHYLIVDLIPSHPRLNMQIRRKSHLLSRNMQSIPNSSLF
jgi:hypothetical protein